MCKIPNGIDNVIVYQDDVLVLSPNVEEHNLTLQKVLSALKEASIKLNTNKCKFFTDNVQYLGHTYL